MHHISPGDIREFNLEYAEESLVHTGVVLGCAEVVDEQLRAIAKVDTVLGVGVAGIAPSGPAGRLPTTMLQTSVATSTGMSSSRTPARARSGVATYASAVTTRAPSNPIHRADGSVGRIVGHIKSECTVADTYRAVKRLDSHALGLSGKGDSRTHQG